MRKINRKKPVIIGRAHAFVVPPEYYGELHPWYDKGLVDSIEDIPMLNRSEFPGEVEWEAYWTGYNSHKNRPFWKRSKRSQQIWNADIDRDWFKRMVKMVIDALYEECE